MADGDAREPVRGNADALFANPMSQVMFRAGLLAARETIAAALEEEGHETLAEKVRKRWWPKLGADPGAPRQLAFNEVALENAGGGFDINPAMTASIEALPVAMGFLANVESVGPDDLQCPDCNEATRTDEGEPRACACERQAEGEHAWEERTGR